MYPAKSNTKLVAESGPTRTLFQRVMRARLSVAIVKRLYKAERCYTREQKGRKNACSLTSWVTRIFGWRKSSLSRRAQRLIIDRLTV